ncbi:PREDICTED: deleted in malignant brain tumors 1 protein-like [Amphimedon queenslandica]|uniref:SRCR domain-containing protein n=1 Tax=Amphimedon queenslandica TaxID=400682 RepID=A0A1X7SYL9_AMPQE|nr:PREDICTED: deleted in malignant brain tumors 1 protein-like [Amphimedon queenslandica]|eukprot:XP_011408605.2 PREDICTED: deleted in malignant brain tumors 1 protein-like [Amphimedon queenslandica]
MRLNGGGVRHGRVEVCISEVWTTICSDYWDYEDASVACRQLGYSPYGAIPLTSYFTDYDWSYGILDPNCTGLESNIWNCSHNEVIDSNTCTGYEDAGVICQSGTIQPVNCETGDIRLIGGTTSNEGRLEVCVNRVWGTVCGVSWGSTDSRVACRQLGHQELGSVSGYGLYGQGSGPVVFGYMYCNGNEDTLFDCRRNEPSVASGTCTSHSYDVGLRCEPKCESGSIRLGGGTSSSNGRVEVCVDKAWGTICSDYWDNDDASVVCKQLGYSPYGAIGAPGSGSITNNIWPHHITDVNCTGNENNLFSCPSNGLTGYNCPNSNFAIISCQNIGTLKADCTEGEVRLVNGNTQYEGRVEICINRVWGTVCSRRDNRWNWSWWNSWHTLDSNVVCRQAGHMELGSVAYTRASVFGQGSGPILISSIQCSGQESHLINCSYSPIIPSYCSHTYDVGVKCEAPCANGTVRLYSDSGSYFRRYGRVQVCVNNAWGTICDHFWDKKDASVVCRMLGYSPYGASALRDSYTEGTWYIHINDLNCTGAESSLWDCPMNGLNDYSCYHYDDAAVLCQLIGVENSTCTTGEVRLADGATVYEGRVEVCENGVWGSVCTRSSSNVRNAYTFCQELGYQGGIVLPSSNFGVSNNPILIYELSCGAFQSNLSNCYQRKYPHYYGWWWYGCNNYQELSIRCESLCVNNKIELYGGPSSRHGNIRVCVNGSWVMVCGYGNTVIDNNLASVVCSSIGYSAYGKLNILFVLRCTHKIYTTNTINPANPPKRGKRGKGW